MSIFTKTDMAVAPAKNLQFYFDGARLIDTMVHVIMKSPAGALSPSYHLPLEDIANIEQFKLEMGVLE